MSPTADTTTDARVEAPTEDPVDEADDSAGASVVVESSEPDAASSPGRFRGRLRVAVVVVGLGVAAASGVWLTAYAAPVDAAPEEFCRAYGLPRGLDGDASVVSRTNLLRGQAPELASTGTPEDIPRISRDGFEVYAALSGAVTPAQVEALGDGQGGSLDGGELDGEALRRELGLDAEDATRLSAFVKYAAATCFSTPGLPAS